MGSYDGCSGKSIDHKIDLSWLGESLGSDGEAEGGAQN